MTFGGVATALRPLTQGSEDFNAGLATEKNRRQAGPEARERSIGVSLGR